MLKSLVKNKTGIMLMLISSLCVCTGQLFWKLSINNGLLFLLMGFALYGVGAVIMIIAYRFGDLSVLQPMLSLNYVLTIVFAVTVLNETMTLFKVGGIIFIITGVLVIGGGDDST